MPHRGELGTDQAVERRFQAQHIGYLVVPEARHVGRRLQVRTEVKNVHQQLRVSLRLHIAAHERHGQPARRHAARSPRRVY